MVVQLQRRFASAGGLGCSSAILCRGKLPKVASTQATGAQGPRGEWIRVPFVPPPLVLTSLLEPILKEWPFGEGTLAIFGKETCVKAVQPSKGDFLVSILGTSMWNQRETRTKPGQIQASKGAAAFQLPYMDLGSPL